MMNGYGMESQHEFSYVPRWSTIITCGAFFSVCAVVLGMKARANDAGMLLDGLIRLSPGAATIFLWVLCSIALLMVFLSIVLMVQRLRYAGRIVVRADDIIVPVSPWSGREQSVAYRSMTEFKLVRMRWVRILRIVHGGGVCTIASSRFASDAHFSELVELIRRRCAAAADCSTPG
ncbi:MAG: hypothetical protein JST22_12530 [Bacteroidetes bacterium]|nr:hypothetical protein [Bacteroidota bacterium]